MDMIWQATLDGYVKLLYDNDPQGPLLESIRDFEKRFCQVAEENRGNPDVAGVLSRAGFRMNITGCTWRRSTETMTTVPFQRRISRRYSIIRKNSDCLPFMSF